MVTRKVDGYNLIFIVSTGSNASISLLIYIVRFFDFVFTRKNKAEERAYDVVEVYAVKKNK